MPAFDQQEQPSDPQNPNGQPPSARYHITRKGSRYNIVGPNGRVFTKLQSAAEAGPRWEELTHTPWPYESSAYESGLRLWELGIIPREHVGLTRLLTPRSRSSAEAVEASSDVPVPKPPAKSAQPKPANKRGAAGGTRKSAPSKATPPQKKKVSPGKQNTDTRAVSHSDAATTDKRPGSQPAAATPPRRKPTAPADTQLRLPLQGIALRSASPVRPVVLALPAPRVDLAEQSRVIERLREDPGMLFEKHVRRALLIEVEYHRPQARWAKTLLRILDRYERHQARQPSQTARQGQAILDKHVAWQEEQLARAAVTS